MDILLWVIFGIVAGVFARRVMNGPVAGGIPVAIALGVTGSLIGGFVTRYALQPNAREGFDIHSLLLSMSGALFVLFCYRCYAMRGVE